mmetsp:Transcript_9660/g.30631  ORF Transcript_9660/g.30631 Transcript_9660/m.30631 type:complete len:404 (-) Transcript_9660:1209-2420(-)
MSRYHGWSGLASNLAENRATLESTDGNATKSAPMWRASVATDASSSPTACQKETSPAVDAATVRAAERRTCADGDASAATSVPRCSLAAGRARMRESPARARCALSPQPMATHAWAKSETPAAPSQLKNVSRTAPNTASTAFSGAHRTRRAARVSARVASETEPTRELDAMIVAAAAAVAAASAVPSASASAGDAASRDSVTEAEGRFAVSFCAIDCRQRARKCHARVPNDRWMSETTSFFCLGKSSATLAGLVAPEKMSQPKRTVPSTRSRNPSRAVRSALAAAVSSQQTRKARTTSSESGTVSSSISTTVTLTSTGTLSASTSDCSVGSRSATRTPKSPRRCASASANRRPAAARAASVDRDQSASDDATTSCTSTGDRLGSEVTSSRSRDIDEDRTTADE